MNRTQASNFVETELLSRFANARLSPKQIDDWIEALAGFDYNGSVSAIKELSAKSRTIPLISDFQASAAKYKPIKHNRSEWSDYSSVKRKYIICTKSNSSLSVGFFTVKHLIAGKLPCDAEFIQAYKNKYNADFEIIEADFDQIHQKSLKLRAGF